MKSEDKTPRRPAPLLLTLFTLPFTGGALVALWLVGSTLYQAVQMQSWVEVPAMIDQAYLDGSTSRKSKSYRIEAEYSYEYQGARFQGSRVSHSVGDNVGSFNQEAYDQLKEHVENRTPFRVYVNPNNPSESILYREIRWELVGFYLIFFIAFGAVGFGGPYIALRRRTPTPPATTSSETSSARSFSPEHPWTAREEWRKGVIEYSSKVGFFFLLFFSILWNAAAVPATLTVQDALNKGEYMATLFLIFPLVGLGLIWMTFHTYRQWRKFGTSKFRIRTVPVEPGGELAGEIDVPFTFPRGTTAALHLSCERSYTTGTGKQQRTHIEKLWTTSWNSTPQPIGANRGSRITVSFTMPTEVEETSEQKRICWKLMVQAELPGTDFSSIFELPVFIRDRAEGR